MNKKTYIPRIVLGLIFVLAGLNGFLSFLPGLELSSSGETFINSLRESGFIWPLINLVELVAGSLLLFNVFGQLAVLLLAPICLGIVLFHMLYSIQGSTIAWVAVALEVTMMFLYRKNLLNIFKQFKEDSQGQDYQNGPINFTKGGHHSRDSRVNNNVDKQMSVEKKQEQEMVANRPEHPDDK